MIVMKFGGTAIGDARRMGFVFDIIRRNIERKPVLVVSAHAKITDGLIALARDAARGHATILPVRQFHYGVLRGLSLPPTLLDSLLQELERAMESLKVVKDLTPRMLDYVASFGERLSARTTAAYLTECGVPAVAVDAFDAGMVTDSNFGCAAPLPQAEARICRSLKNIRILPVITGFIGKDRDGNITTMGRSGSDLTAALVASAVDAREIQIWRDVDGVMTADPAIVTDARQVKSLDFDEATTLSYFGGRFLHPLMFGPAVSKGIPIRVVNMFKPNSKGTLITGGRRHAPQGTVKAIVCKRNMLLMNVVAKRVMLHKDFVPMLFDTLAEHLIVPETVAASATCVEMTLPDEHNLERVVARLSGFAEVTIEGERAIVCAVGDGVRDSYDCLGRILGVLKAGRMRSHVLSCGAHANNVTVLVDDGQAHKTVRLFHDEFFGGDSGGRRVRSAARKRKRRL
jgi:aspartate kinase